MVAGTVGGEVRLLGARLDGRDGARRGAQGLLLLGRLRQIAHKGGLAHVACRSAAKG